MLNVCYAVICRRRNAQTSLGFPDGLAPVSPTLHSAAFALSGLEKPTVSPDSARAETRATGFVVDHRSDGSGVLPSSLRTGSRPSERGPASVSCGLARAARSDGAAWNAKPSLLLTYLCALVNVCS